MKVCRRWDHKRAGDGDTGLNTGGMGTFSPSPFYTEEVDEFCKKHIYQATVDAMKAEGREARVRQLEIQGEYKEAYLRCMECLEKGIEVEFAQKKCEYLIPMMRKKNKTSNRWMYIIAVLASLALLTAGFLYGILSN